MKFENNTYWKHENCRDAFFCADRVVFDDGKISVLKGTWCIQGTAGWWFSVDDEIEINQNEYDKWFLYAPKGGLL